MPFGSPIKLFSTFVSINGEVCRAHQGSLATFIRFAGCNLRCSWCDTVYAQKEDSGHEYSFPEVISLIRANGPKNVTITGGEPFMQKDGVNDLCLELVRTGYNVSVETNGSFRFDPIPWINYIVDFKLPSSEEYHHMRVETPWMSLRHTDWIKFVVKDNPDYETAKATIMMLKRKGCKAKYAMSPVHTHLSGNRILQWLKFDRMFDVVISLQLHKLVDLNEPD